MTASKLAALSTGDISTDNSTVAVASKPVDVLVGTTSKVLEMVRGHGWNWDKVLQESKESSDSFSQRKKFVVGEPEVGLERVEWVVVDEADVLFGT
jgi:ATP-dependent RNA helicase MRH4, mitochondrial